MFRFEIFVGTVAILIEVFHSFSQPLQPTLLHYPDYATTASFHIFQSSSLTIHFTIRRYIVRNTAIAVKKTSRFFVFPVNSSG